MVWFAIIGVFIASDPVQVPIAGRPVDFSGAVGGPFVVTASVDRDNVNVEEPIELTISITGPGDLSRLRRPNLNSHDEFKERFYVIDGDSRSIANGHSFSYVLRPSSEQVAQIPRIKLVYYNPLVGRSDRGFQTTYSNAIELRVSSVLKNPVELPAALGDWVASWRSSSSNANGQRGLLHRAANSQNGWLWWAYGVPPLLAALWIIVARRSRRSESAIAMLNRATEKLGNDPGGHIAKAVKDVWDSHRGQSESEYAEAMRRCDELRYSGATSDPTAALQAARAFAKSIVSRP